jgi:polynucleotide 5'-hydroxyl-kinase GRC3/NOL9
MPDIPKEWEEVAQQVLPRADRIILVGATDTGKSTLATYLANQAVRRGYKTAVVDADVGQSDVGPPATVGMGILAGEVASLTEIPLADFYFVGSLSPRGRLTEMVVGTKKMVEKARELGAERVIVDTTGLVQGNLGRTLKHHKVDLIRPAAIVALQRRGELEALLRVWEALGYRVWRLSAIPEEYRRSAEVRAAFRQKRWQEFFGGARLRKIAVGRTLVRGAPLFRGTRLGAEAREKIKKVLGQEVLWAEKTGNQGIVVTRQAAPPEALGQAAASAGIARLVRLAPDCLAGRVVSLVGEGGRHLSLGYVAGMDYGKGELWLYTPYLGEDVRLIQFGLVRLKAEEIGANHLFWGETPCRSSVPTCRV